MIVRSKLSYGVFEVTAGVALVTDDRASAAVHDRADQQAECDLAFFAVGGDQRERAWRAVGRAGEVQAHAPEPARVAAAVAVAADVGQLRAACGVARAAALDGRGVEQDDRIVRGRAVSGVDAEQPLDRVREPCAALMQRTLAGQFREQVADLAARGTQEAPVRWDPHQHLRHAQCDDLGVGQLASPIGRLLRQEIISAAINTDAEEIEVGVHRGPQADGALDTADFDLPAQMPFHQPRTTTPAVESII